MVQQWEPGTQYDYDSVVVYEGVAYKIIQPHRSQGDWTPPQTPALWGRMQDQSCAGGGGGGHHHHHHEKEGQNWDQQGQQQQPQQQPQYGQQQPQYGGGAPAQPTEEERKTNWLDLSDERKKQLEIGGGLVAGLGLLGGGLAAFQAHKKGQEEQKADAWALSNWIHDAQARAAAYHRDGPRGPYTWVLTHGNDNFPQGVIEGGREKSGDVLYIARVFHEGGVHVGKAGRHLKGAVIGYGGKEVIVDTYEVLLGDTSKVRWVPVSDSAFSPQAAVEGGKEADGTTLFIAQAYYEGGTHPGKYSDKMKGACIAYGKNEKLIKDNFRILILNQ